MKGRIYDPEIGRFLSPDPFIQSMASVQNVNRYSYVNNNPFSYTDPSGYLFSKLFKQVFKQSILRPFGKHGGGNPKNWTQEQRLVVGVPLALAGGVAAYNFIFWNGAATSANIATIIVQATTAAGAATGGISGGISTGDVQGAVNGAILGISIANSVLGLHNAASIGSERLTKYVGTKIVNKLARKEL